MNWMTVKELAKYLKISEMMVYKLAQNSEIPAAKIGSNWRFSQREIDEWLVNKTRKGSWLGEPAETVMSDFVNDLKKTFGNNLVSVIVFGSYARGDAGPDSDLDIAVILKSIPDYWDTKTKIEDIAYANTFDKERYVTIASVLMNEREFLTGLSPLLLNIRKEGRKAA